jgi:hypothetical protein
VKKSSSKMEGTGKAYSIVSRKVYKQIKEGRSKVE